MSLSHIIDKDKLNSFAQQAIPPIKTAVGQLGTALGALSDEIDGIENGLGTAASKDVPSSGDAGATEVVMGNDSRLTDARTPTAHTHDDRYYTETEIDEILNAKMNYSNPVGFGSLSIGRKANTALGPNSHAVGQDVSATATAAHAEGQGTTASATAAHSEGRQTTASADYSHAEGRNTLASNLCSHAEGRNTVASGANSHAGGYFTEASGDYSTAIGKANDYQAGDLFEVGNGVVESGTVISRSNAFRVTSTGEVIDGFGNKISDISDVTTISSSTSNTPYLYRSNAHSAVYDTLIGATVAYNQLVKNGDFVDTSEWGYVNSNISVVNQTLTTSSIISSGEYNCSQQISNIVTGHKYLTIFDISSEKNAYIYVSYSYSNQFVCELSSIEKKHVYTVQGNEQNDRLLFTASAAESGAYFKLKNVMCIDLTLMFGSEIADYVYSLEQSETGTGLAFLQSYGFLTESYYPYNAGELLSVKPSAKKVVGKNLIDGLMAGVWLGSTGEQHTEYDSFCCSVKKIKIMPNKTYTLSFGANAMVGTDHGVLFYDIYGNYLGHDMMVEVPTSPITFTTPSNARYCTININTYLKNEPYAQLELGSTATAYEPYHEVVYPLPNTELRGLIKLHNDTDGTWLYADGDVCESVGKTERKYILVDLGTLDWYDSTNDGSGVQTWTTTLNVFSIAKAGINDEKANIICQKYQTDTADRIYSGDADMSIGMTASGYITLHDSNFTGYTGAQIKTALSGVYLVAEATTPTTEYTLPFASPQALFKGGTEEFVDTRAVPMPVGHESTYIDLPEWLNNQYIDDIRTQASQVPALQNQVNIIQKRTAPVYGFHIDGNESDPSAKVTYLADAVGMTPAYMNYTNDVFNYGSWSDIFFIEKLKPLILNADGSIDTFLSKTDTSKDIDGNTVDIATKTANGDKHWMIQFPKIYICIKPSSDGHSADIYVSDTKINDDFKCWSYYNKDGVLVPHFYYPMFKGSIVNNKLVSIPQMTGASGICKNKTASEERNLAQANGIGWDTVLASDRQLINILLMLIGKSTNSQAVFGNGIIEGDETAFNSYTTGELLGKGLFYGYNDNTHSVKVLGIENYWSLQWDRCLGDILLNGDRKYKACYGYEDGSTVADFNFTGEGYPSSGVTQFNANGNYISQMKYNEKGMFASAATGSNNTYYADGMWVNNGITAVALFAGLSDLGLICGASAVCLNGDAGGAWWYVGASPSYR